MTTSNIVCPNCDTTNRIPTDRLADGPKCGECKQALFQGKVQILNASNVSKVTGRNEIPVLVDCWAPWCGPCRNFAPVFEQAAAEYEPQMRLAKLNTEDEQTVAARWNIRSIPTLILFKQGKEAARMSGALSAGQLKEWINANR